MKNKNIHINEDEDTYTIQPYDRELTLKYVRTCIKQILKHAQGHTFTLVMPTGYYLDGLSETNNNLIQQGKSKIYNKYAEQQITL